MKKEMNGWIAFLIIIFSAFVMWKAADYNNLTSATAIGTINVSGYLNVRKGPGKSYACLKSGGTKVTLSNSAQVTILAKNGKWYKIRFKQNGKKLKGYVYSKYLSVLSGDVCTNVTGKVNPKAVIVRKKAGKKGAVLKQGLTTVKLPKKTRVTILSESVQSSVKWYQVSFTYKKKLKKGYVKSDAIVTDYAAAIPGVIKTSDVIYLRKDAGKVTTVKQNGAPITMVDGSQVLMVSEKTVNGIKYVGLEVVVGEKNYQGYVASNLVRFQQVKVEEPEATPTPEPAPIPKATPKPTPEPTVKETADPVESKKPVSDAQFKKDLKAEGFPDSYVTQLMKLHTSCPNWEFKAFQTGIDWSDAVENESKVGLNLISVNKSSDWKSFEEGAYNWTTDKYIPFDGSTWVTASRKAVMYYMDPRNFLDSGSIFQFENLEYQENIQSKSGVEDVLKNTPMYKNTYSYTDTDKTEHNISYSQTFMDAAESSGVSPFHLASRAKQEVVTGSSSMSSSVSGTVVGYEGLYNFYNIGAYNSTAAGGAIANGLAWAAKSNTYSRPWNSPYRSIVGGAQYIGSNYINVGQNTLYLQKFNVTSSRTYNHQYMSNIEAPNSEGSKTVAAYGTDKTSMNIAFTIPVYKNMPSQACSVPSGGSNPNNYLKSLSVKGFPFDSRFKLGDNGSKIYTLTVPNTVKSISIKAAKVSSVAKLSGKGTKKLKVGKKTFTVKVKSESGVTRKYKIRVTRLKK